MRHFFYASCLLVGSGFSFQAGAKPMSAHQEAYQYRPLNYVPMQPMAGAVPTTAAYNRTLAFRPMAQFENQRPSRSFRPAAQYSAPYPYAYAPQRAYMPSTDWRASNYQPYPPARYTSAPYPYAQPVSMNLMQAPPYMHSRGHGVPYRTPAYSYQRPYAMPAFARLPVPLYHPNGSYRGAFPWQPSQMMASYSAPAAWAQPHWMPGYSSVRQPYRRPYYNRPAMRAYPEYSAYNYGAPHLQTMPQYRYRVSYPSYAASYRPHPYSGYAPVNRHRSSGHSQFRPLSNEERLSGYFSKMPSDTLPLDSGMNDFQPVKQGYRFRPMSG